MTFRAIGRGLIRAVATVAVTLCVAGIARADDASAAWRKVLKNCATTDVIGNNSLFFGVSNTIGPGSIWRFADDKSLRLMFELADAFPSDTDQKSLIKDNNVAACTGDASTSWNLKLGLPFSTGVTPLSVSLGLTLGRAKKVTVSVTGFAVDELKETPWKEAFRKLDRSSAYVQEIAQPNRIIAENTVKVTGFKATFVFGSKLSADVQAGFKGKTFTLGQPGQEEGTSSPASPSSAAAPAGNATPSNASSAGAGRGGSAAGGTSNGNAGTSRGSTQPGQGSASSSPGATSAGSSTAGSGSGTTGATFHADVTGDNTITLTADGPFYLIAAYSKLVGGVPVGLDQPGAAPLVPAPAKLPEGVTPKTDRKRP